MCGNQRENCHDKCLMSVALALAKAKQISHWKQLSRYDEEWNDRHKQAASKKMMREKIFKTYFSDLNASRIIKGEAKAKRTKDLGKFYDSWFIFKGTWIKNRAEISRKCVECFNKTLSFVKFLFIFHVWTVAKNAGVEDKYLYFTFQSQTCRVNKVEIFLNFSFYFKVDCAEGGVRSFNLKTFEVPLN